METIATLLILIVLSALGAKLLELKKHLPGVIRDFLYTNIEFLVLGLLVGRLVLHLHGSEVTDGDGVVTEQSLVFLHSFDPFLQIGLGWIGFFIGLQFKWSKLQRFPRASYNLALLQSFFGFAFSTILFLTIFYFTAGPTGWSIAAALTMGVVGSVTAPIALGYFHGGGGKKGDRGNEARLLEFASSVDDVPSLVLFGLLTVALPGITPTGVLVLDVLIRFVLYFILSAVLAYFFSLVMQRFHKEDEERLFVLGLLILSSGVAVMLHLSPLFMLFLLGAMLANITKRSEELYQSMVGLERPVYILFLLLAGAGWTFSIGRPGIFILLIILYIAVRLVGKMVGMRYSIHLTYPNLQVNRWCGFGLFSQGALALTMVINLALLTSREAFISEVLTVLLVAIITIELLAPMALRPFVRRIEGE